MKIALIHDHITCKAGGERVALAFHKAFPKAPIYTLAYDKEAAFDEFKECDIRTSWLQKITKKEAIVKKLFFPLGIIAMRTSFYLDEYDIVLISGTHCGKYVRFSEKTIVINYCFTPFRLAWVPESYAEFNNSTGIKKNLFKIIINRLKANDLKHAKRVNFFLAMTNETRDRIQNCYQPISKISIINPPVNNINKYSISEENKEYYLLVSRLEFYKKVDLVIDAFNLLNFPLIIVGNGSKEKELKRLAKSNIIFKKNISDYELAELYKKSKAFVFPQHEDYGLTALEANSCGIPVIAFNKGGILDTQIPYSDSYDKCTALLFHEQNVESLSEKVIEFEKNKMLFDKKFIRKHAELFSEERFISQIQEFIKGKSAQI
jgi:glycosyltransferase involved in cell wall biosynthesis